MKIAKLQTTLSLLADEARLDMICQIQALRKNPARPDHALENAITVEHPAINYWGIGNISKLNAEAPHWELINDGGKYITKETHVVPTTYFANPKSPYVTFKAGSEHIIEPVRYVDIAFENLRKHIEEQLNNLLK